MRPIPPLAGYGAAAMLAVSLACAAGCGSTAGAGAPAPAKTAPTAADQSETPDDLAITKRIRQSVMADDTLGATAKNVAIITAHGEVTLRGKVESVRAKAQIGVRARQIAGTTHVDNRIEVADEPPR